MSINDGGPAFPQHGGSEGMTLRDYFAAVAMQGELACRHREVSPTFDISEMAFDCYLIADEMLEARKATRQPDPSTSAQAPSSEP